MKVLTVNNAWAGGWLDHVAQGLQSLGNEIINVRFERQNSLLRTMKLHNVVQIGQSLADRDIIHFNELVLQRFEEYYARNVSYDEPEQAAALDN